MTPDPSDPRQAAAAALGLAADPDSAAAAAAFAVRLTEYEFAPPDEAIDAAIVLGALPAGPERAAAHDRFRARRLEAEVDRLADTYWTLGPGDRRQQWAVLVAAAGQSPPAADRLRRLEAGLDAARPPAEASGPVADLARLVCDVYPLRPADRAAVRRAWVRRTLATGHSFARLAAAVRQEYPDLTPLAADVLDAPPGGPPQRWGDSLRAALRALGVGYPGWWVGPVVVLSVAGIYALALLTKGPAPDARKSQPAPAVKEAKTTTTQTRP